MTKNTIMVTTTMSTLNYNGGDRYWKYLEGPNCSHIVIKYLPNHSLIIGGHLNNNCREWRTPMAIYNMYSQEVLNPAFTSMALWKICQNHQINDYIVSKQYTIISGLLMYGSDIYISSPQYETKI